MTVGAQVSTTDIPADRVVGRAQHGRVALVIPDLSLGGAERNVVRLAAELRRRGRTVDLIVGSDRGPLGRHLPQDVSLIDLHAPRLRAGLLPLIDYLRRHPPDVMLATIGHAIVLAVAASRLSGTGTPVVARLANTVPARGVSIRDRAGLAVSRAAYRAADGLVTNSAESAAALADLTGVDVGSIAVLPNLTVGSELLAPTVEPPDHPWFAPEERTPVVLAIGRLTPAKDHGTLIDAVARVAEDRPVRLVVLGEGPARGELEQRVRRHGLTDVVDLPGSVEDTVAYLRHATLFCLSSRREGMPNALIEALAAGLPVVSTDCRSGPRELLADGRYGRLVAPGDAQEMADAIVEALDRGRAAPPEAWARHTVEHAGEAYDRHLDRYITSSARSVLREGTP